MKSVSYGNLSMSDQKEYDDFSCINNECASCLYEAGKLATNDVLAAVIENELTETEKTAIKLYWFRKMKINHIAAVSGVSETSIRKSLMRAYKRIGSVMKYIVLYNEMLDGKNRMPEDFDVKIIRCADGKEFIPR